MKNLGNIKNKILARYKPNNFSEKNFKSTDINVLLNRVKLNQKKESRKKLYFSAAASSCLFLFAVIIF